MSPQVRSVLVGIAIAAVVLLLDDLADALGGTSARGTAIRWSVLVQVAVGIVAVWAAARGRSDWVVPAVAAVVLAWPLLAATFGWWPTIPAWVPLLAGAPVQPVVVGVLATGAVAGRRLG